MASNDDDEDDNEDNQDAAEDASEDSGEDEDEDEDEELNDGSSDGESSAGASIHFDDSQHLDLNSGTAHTHDEERGTTKTDDRVDHNVKITFPADLRSPSPVASGSSSPAPSSDRHTSHKGKGKQPARALWTDPADEMISVDLIKDRRMRKLARGKGKEGVVDGRELEQRLREQ